MTGRSSRSVRDRCRRLAAVVAFCASLVLPPFAQADSIVLGRVIDKSTRSALVGARVEIRKGSDLLQTVYSGADGRFRLPFTIEISPIAQNLTLLIAHEDHAEYSKILVVVSGNTEKSFYEIELLPRSLAACLVARRHGIVVGSFLSPIAAGPSYQGLAFRIADALYYNLLTRIQQFHLPADFQPFFQACDEAKPRSISAAGDFARALGADAFLSGYVTRSGTKYKVETFVGDRFDVFVPPFLISNDGVDLDAPGAAELDASTHAAILTALAAGYAESGNAAECVDVTVAAEQMLGRLEPATRQVREQCQGELDNRGLLRGGGP